MNKYVMVAKVAEEIQKDYPTKKFCCYLLDCNTMEVPHVNYYDSFSYCINSALSIANECNVPLVLYDKECREWMESMLR
jgi:hypothetical protein